MFLSRMPSKVYLLLLYRPGDGTSFPIDRSKLAQLQKIIKEIRSVDSSEESEESS